MRALLPDPAPDVDEVTAYALPPGPHVRANMVESADGAGMIDGRSGGLGSTADQRLFALLRSLADVVLVGAGTVRTEGYGPVRPSARRREVRVRLGLPAVPPIAVVSASLALDPESPFFTEADPAARPLLVTTAAAAAGDGAGAYGDRAEIVVAGEDRVDAARAVDELHRRGYRHVLCEGGPTLLAQLAAAGRLDELCLTLSPLLAGPGPGRIVAGDQVPLPVPLRLAAALEEGGFLFLRYAVASAAGSA